MVQVERVLFTDGVIIDGRGKFEGKLPLSLEEVCEWLGVPAEDRWQVELSGEEATALEEHARSLERSGGGE